MERIAEFDRKWTKGKGVNDNRRQNQKIGGGRAVLLLAISVLTGITFGSETIDFFDLSESHAAILYEIRLPRVLLGASVGACLAVAGAALQSLLRNPLAEPYLLGVSNGAALGHDAGVCISGFF